ncbi:uncharacterized protein SAPINGB_P001712 [Magnusiomyces paraingens]|uniref:GPI transamidase component GAA1 n=1 Tax=Magnusiomyces paraingens TaxID=2606893 RepID=A0A5E8B724_9ASCO|nr:uncharacterized protein SAPINGB_P001712 [Saprochaete ingens]VVT47440.1 unnamed protein product [Saprochaete ingens]
MGLFDLIQRLNVRFKLLDKAIHIIPYISFLSVLAGFAILLSLPMEGVYRNTYISENALLPAQAQTYFRESEWNIVRGYRKEVHQLEHVSPQERTQTLRTWFDDIGLKTSFHNWDISYGAENKSGTNVYGILHAPRGENTEAMVLVAPCINKDGDYNDGGVALVAALARYLKKWSVWSKNIIFVVTSDSHFSMRSWVSDYHTSMANTAGSIEAAIVLDYPAKSDYFDEIEITYEGLNGQLPNLDLFNTAVLIAGHENLRTVVQNMNTVNYLHYITRAKILFRGILAQLSAGLGPGPGSETFSGWRINAITLRARGSKGPADITTFGRVAESTLRSINNLLEHFHQSFFFFLLLSPRNFVSIGTYLPAAIALAISYPLMATYNIATAKISLGSSKLISNFWKNATYTQIAVLAPSLLLAIIYATSIIIGYLSLNTFSTSTVVFSTHAIIAMHTIITFAVIARSMKKKSAQGPTPPTALELFHARYIPLLPAPVLAYTRAYAMIFHGLILTTLSMLNFSLSILVGAATFPLVYISSRYPVSAAVSLYLTSPWIWLVVISTLTNAALGNNTKPTVLDPSSLASLVAPLDQIIENLLWAWRGMDVWTWGIIVGFWLPFWLVGLAVALMDSGEDTPTPPTTKEKKSE